MRAKRLTVAFLWLEDKTGDPNLAHWRYGSGFLDSALGKTKTLRPLSSGAVDYAYQKMELQAGDLVDLNLARRMGQEIEAQRIVWGSYQKIADRWRVDLRVLNVATGAVSPALSAVASEWHDVRDALVSQLLDELRVTPTADEQKEMASRRTHSPEALVLSTV